MKDRSTPLSRIHHLKLIIVGVALVLVGLLLSLFADWLAASAGASRLLVATFRTLSDVLLVTGAIGIAVDVFTGRDKEAADTERLRHVLKDAAPDIRNAVIEGFAETPEGMRGVATTETLDKLATNALALRLDDPKFAAEIYEGLLAQAIHTPERWSDVDINVRLSCIQETSTRGAPRSDVLGPLFDVVVTWEYTVIPSTRIQRFASTNSLDEFREFLDDVPATAAWYIPDKNTDPREPSAFQVIAYSIDGKDQAIRRTVRKHGQTYSVDLGEDGVAKGEPVRIRQVYRTVVPRYGHRFRIALVQPTYGMRLVLDYTDTDIADLKVGEMVSSAVAPQIKFLPAEAPAKQVEVAVPGWLLPKSEITAVWTLEGELPPRQ